MAEVTLTFEAPRVGTSAADSWGKVAGLDLGKIRETDLRYKLFQAKVTFEAGGVELIEGFRLALVDLALGMATAVELLRSGQDAAIGFTESADAIYFDHFGDVVRVRYLVSNRAERDTVRVSTAELQKAMHLFIESVYERLIGELPGLAENPVIQRFAPKRH